MANTKSMKKPVKEEVINDTDITVEEIAETPVKKPSKKAKEYQNGDMIPCRSVTAGEMFCLGKKSGIMYRWANHGYVEDVRYEDLVYMRDSRSGYMYKPRFIIEDTELLTAKGWDKVSVIYDAMFTQRDIDEILNLPIGQFKSALKQLPVTIQGTIKVVIAEKIDNGTFDSINKIKAVDEVLGSDLMCLIK